MTDLMPWGDWVLCVALVVWGWLGLVWQQSLRVRTKTQVEQQFEDEVTEIQKDFHRNQLYVARLQLMLDVTQAFARSQRQREWPQ
jgi:hypothetical protein